MMINKGSNMFILITGLELDYNINILQHLHEPYIPSLFNEYWMAIFVSIIWWADIRCQIMRVQM